MTSFNFFQSADLVDADTITITGAGTPGPDFDQTPPYDVGEILTGYSVPLEFVGVVTAQEAFLVSYEISPGVDVYYVVTDVELPTGSYDFTEEPFLCLLAGTLVATPAGERQVEDLRIGDEILTADGQAVPVRWVGRQSRITRFATREAVPIMIREGVLADGIPSHDLCVSRDHAILVDSYLVNAHALINGTTILPMPEPPAQLDYYHLELDRHRVIIANGTPVESFVDDVTRAGFDNYDEWVALDLQPLPAEPIGHLKVKSARQLPRALRERLAARGQSPAV